MRVCVCVCVCVRMCVCVCVCVHVCVCVCVLCGCVEDRKELELRGVRVTCASGLPDIHAPPSDLQSLTRGPPITGFESSVCCVIYCYPTSYRGRSTLGTHSFPKG